MRVRRAILKCLQAIVAPQGCVECGCWVLNDDLSPLCGSCADRFERLAGPICLICGNPVPGNVLNRFALCRQCRASPPPFDRARAWGAYQGTLKRVLRYYKFGGHPRLADPLARLAASALGDEHLENRYSWLIPVPSHRRRIRERGFDHIGRLANCLSTRIQAPVFDGLFRTRNTRPQFGLDRSQRRRNIRGAFKLRKAAALDGRRVLLLDDLLTTGTTVGEACRLLTKESSVSKITVLTVARAIMAQGN